MQGLVLEDVKKFVLHDVEKPVPKDNEVLVQVGAVGICGTDLHIFHGLANYHRDELGRLTPLRVQPQTLGHEFCGRIDAVGSRVKKVKAGDPVVVDQVLNCHAQGRVPACEYCASGDSHQCEFGLELGITGLPGAFTDYVAVPEASVVWLPAGLSFVRAAIIEPLGCVAHACERVDRAPARYTLGGKHLIRHALISMVTISRIIPGIYSYAMSVVRREREAQVTSEAGARSQFRAGLLLCSEPIAKPHRTC